MGNVHFFAGLHNHDVSQPILEGRAVILLAGGKSRPHPLRRFRRKDLGARHIFRQRQKQVRQEIIWESNRETDRDLFPASCTM